MRSRKLEYYIFAFVVLPFVLLPSAWAMQKQRTIIIALDQSGSMRRSDPNNLRHEAAGLLVTTEAANDQIGIIAFGESAQWLQKPISRGQFDFKRLNNVGASDAHTSFAPVLQAVEEYLISQPSSFFRDHEVCLVLLTDGRSDPAKESADADRSTSLTIAGRNAARLTVYTIGLGGNLDDQFLESLARDSNGLSIRVESAMDLPDAFLRVAARAAALPVYRRSSSPGQLNWAGTPRRVVIAFTGQNASSVRFDGNVLYRSSHVAVAEQDPARGAANLEWTGSGHAFLCVKEPLTLELQTDFPTALLTDAPHPVTVKLESPHGPLKNAFFLDNANAELELAGSEIETAPLHREPRAEVFTGEFEAQRAGSFQARALLESPYGRVETFLGDVIASVTPIAVPQQVSAGVFDPLPRSWFARKVNIRSLLPVGTVHLELSSSGLRDNLPANLNIISGNGTKLKVILGGAPGVTHVVRYLATWSDGESVVSRRGALRIWTHQMTLGELITDKWQWIVAALLIGAVFGVAAWEFWPRPIQADLVVRQNGNQVLRLQLPSQLKTRTLHLSESEAGTRTGSDRAAIAGPHSRELLSLQSARRRGKWTIIAYPRAARVPSQHGRAWSEIDLGVMHVPVFHTDDGTIQINVLYS